MFVLGLGIGLCMQVLTIVVQNTVPYAQLGTATSGVTFFRTLGSTFGAAVFGTLYNSDLGPTLKEALAAVPGVPAEAVQSPAGVKALRAAQAAPIIDAYADAINHVFLWVVPVALVGFAAAWFLKEMPLRDSARAGATDLGEGFAAPDSADRVAQLERSVAAVMRKPRREDDGTPQRILADSGSRLTPGQAWVLGQTYVRSRIWGGGATIHAIARAHRVPGDVVEPVFSGVARAGYVQIDDGRVQLTPAGEGELQLLRAAWRRWLDTRLDDWSVTDPDDRAFLEQALDNIATRLLDEEQTRWGRSGV
ncbi:hypothetical protein ACFOZ0_30255 [Streptomyces yaanensis]|uniref:Uncharacterized protein n=1 Tax=Streptomyces yaanensis TaxID=1142239 RepID=A0ABV7SMC7_9ACTN